MAAVDTSLPTMHVAGGLMLQRQPDGSVRVMVTNGEFPLDTGSNLKFDVTVPHQSWCSAVAHTSARGDTLEGITAVKEALRAAADPVKVEKKRR